MKISRSYLCAAAVATVVGVSGVTLAQQQPPKRPDLNGIWGGGIAQLTANTCKQTVDAFPAGSQNAERFSAGGAKGGLKWITFEQDCSIQNRGRVNKPQYKPQYWERVRMSDYYANAGGEFLEYADPEWLNLPRGVPRLGPPNKIVQTANEIGR